jgi:hypothetical protein
MQILRFLLYQAFHPDERATPVEIGTLVRGKRDEIAVGDGKALGDASAST